MTAKSTPMKIEGRSDKQLAAAIRKKLEKIFWMGDHNECSFKHVYYTTIVILAGARYSLDPNLPQPRDYPNPGRRYPAHMIDDDAAWEAASSKFFARQAPQLEAVWGTIYDAAHEMGPERFVTVLANGSDFLASPALMAELVAEHRHDSGAPCAWPEGSYDGAWMERTIAALNALDGEDDG